MYYFKQLVLVTLFKFLVLSTLQAQNSTLINGTIIITLISNDTIWVGADTRTSALTEKGYTVNKRGMCKIRSTNNVVYAMAGHVRYVDNSFNFLDIMRNSINAEKDFDKAMELFQQKANDEIKSILKRFSKRSINTLIKTNNGSFLSVVAITYTNGERKMIEMKFSVDPDFKVISKVVPGIGVGSLRFLGHAVSAAAYVKNNALFFGNGKNVPQKFVDLIKIEAANGSATVGMPADVISIYNNGYKRVITSGLCP